MVLRLAETLTLPLRDRNDLLVSAGFAPMYRESELDSADREIRRQRMRDDESRGGAFEEEEYTADEFGSEEEDRDRARRDDGQAAAGQGGGQPESDGFRGQDAA